MFYEQQAKFTHIVYKHTNRNNGKAYIGQTSLSMQSRFEKHIADAKHGSHLYFHNAIRKHGVESWNSEILYHCQGLEEAQRAERELIASYATFGLNGYNMSEGGEGSRGHVVSKEIRQRMSTFRKIHSHFVTNPLCGERNHMFRIGTKHPLYGKPRSTETRTKIALNHVDRVGANNTNAKHIRLQSPDGFIYETHGELKKFCKEHNLAYSSMNYILKKGRKFRYGSVKGWRCWIVND